MTAYKAPLQDMRFILHDVLDSTAGTVVSAGNAFVPDATVTVAGMQAKVGGVPADGDSFTLAPSGIKNIFDGLNDAVALLKTPANGAPARARLGMGLADIMAHVDRTLDQTSRARTEAGVALGDLDRIEAAASGLDIGYAQELSQLQDLDYTKAVSELLKQQTAVEAAQKAFAKVMGRSLFDLI